jgi:hypothetical protein
METAIGDNYLIQILGPGFLPSLSGLRLINFLSMQALGTYPQTKLHWYIYLLWSLLIDANNIVLVRFYSANYDKERQNWPYVSHLHSYLIVAQ